MKLPPRWTEDELPLSEAQASRTPHYVLIATGVLVLVGGLWAALFDIDEITRGDGRVITTRQVQQVQNLEGGIVSRILVHEGQTVAQGEVLFQLDEVRFSSAFREGEQSALGLKAKVARLDAEVRGAQPGMPAEVQKTAPALAANELAVHQARQRELNGKVAVLHEQLIQRRQEVLELESRRDNARDQIALLKKEITITAPLVKAGAVSEVELLRLERDLSRLRMDHDGALLALPRTQAAVQEAIRKVEDSRAQFRAQAAGELSSARNELAKVSESVTGLEDRLARTQVKAPVKGIVKLINNKTAGGVVQPGTSLAEIVPLDDAMLIETRIRPQDIAFVHAGQKVRVRLAAYDTSIFGPLDGRVEFVSPDSVQAQAAPGQPGGEAYYIAHIRAASAAIVYRGKALPVIPGMTGEVDILTGRRSVMHYLLKPLNKARERALSER